MITSDSRYWKPLLPTITVRNSSKSTVLYNFSSFTGVTTGPSGVFPLYTSVNLSQNTHGDFICQFDDPNKQLEPIVKIGSVVRISAGKDGASLYRLISGVIRKKGYSRGANQKVLYTIQGSSTGLRLNELVTYNVSKGAVLRDGFTPDPTDPNRKADTLLASALGGLTNDGILSISNLAANSDVETPILNLDIEYGELQDVVNYIEGQSGGEVFIDTNDLIHLRYEMKNNLFGRGFTLKNNRDNQANDDADDTMYLRGKNWSYEDDFYKSSNYANRIYAILPADNRPTREEMGFVPTGAWNYAGVHNNAEFAVKFRPTHTRHFASDFNFVGSLTALGGPSNLVPNPFDIKICMDYFGLPQNTDGLIGIAIFNKDQWPDPIPTSGSEEAAQVHTADILFNLIFGVVKPIYLDVARDYWLIFSGEYLYHPSMTMNLGRNVNITGDNYWSNQGGTMSTFKNGGSNWHIISGFSGGVAVEVGRYRAHAYTMYDPKAMQAISQGLTRGQAVDIVLTDTSEQLTTQQAMYRHIANQISVTSTPRSVFTFPTVTAPNIPPIPGDAIILNDDILGFSTSGKQATILSCGDMNYTWGEWDRGAYQAPTILSINAVGVLPKYS